MDKTKTKNKLSFFKNIFYSIFDFDKYTQFLKENIGQTVLYLAIILILFSLMFTAFSAKTSIDRIDTLLKPLKNNISSISLENDILTVNDNNKVEFETDLTYNGIIVIDTSDLDEEKINEYRKLSSEDKTYYIFLNNKFIVNYPGDEGRVEESYASLKQTNSSDMYLINSIVKNWDSLDNNNIVNTAVVITSFLDTLYIYFINTALNLILISTLSYLSAKILKVNIRYNGAFKIASHAITLPIVLDLIYNIINVFTYFEIPYFIIMYFGVSYIYVLTALFMMKSDNVTMQKELNKIKEVEDMVKEELKLDIINAQTAAMELLLIKVIKSYSGGRYSK